MVVCFNRKVLFFIRFMLGTGTLYLYVLVVAGWWVICTSLVRAMRYRMIGKKKVKGESDEHQTLSQ